MTEQERNTAFKAKLAELVVIVKELHGLAKLCFPHENPLYPFSLWYIRRYLRRNQGSMQIFRR